MIVAVLTVLSRRIRIVRTATINEAGCFADAEKVRLDKTGVL